MLMMKMKMENYLESQTKIKECNYLINGIKKKKQYLQNKNNGKRTNKVKQNNNN